jgi:hypothetical protein
MYMAMELMDGSLTSLKIEPKHALVICEEVFRALQRLIAANIFYQDLKQDNVLYSRGGDDLKLTLGDLGAGVDSTAFDHPVVGMTYPPPEWALDAGEVPACERHVSYAASLFIASLVLGWTHSAVRAAEYTSMRKELEGPGWRKYMPPQRVIGCIKTEMGALLADEAARLSLGVSPHGKGFKDFWEETVGGLRAARPKLVKLIDRLDGEWVGWAAKAMRQKQACALREAMTRAEKRWLKSSPEQAGCVWVLREAMVAGLNGCSLGDMHKIVESAINANKL